MLKRKPLLVLTFVFVAVPLSCSNPASQLNRESSPKAASSQVKDDLGPGKRRVSKVDYGDEWPLSVDSGILACRLSAVTFESEGKTYALNGVAMGRKWGIDVSQIQLDDNSIQIPGAKIKMSVGWLIRDGLKLCEQ